MCSRFVFSFVFSFLVASLIFPTTALAVFDIDNFKNYNDTNGHKAGDALLIELSRLMQSDTRKEATVARFGGEEFIIMLPGISKKEAFSYADRLRKKISQHCFPYKEKQPLGRLYQWGYRMFSGRR